jgi:hypothetical protein
VLISLVRGEGNDLPIPSASKHGSTNVDHVAVVRKGFKPNEFS